VFVDPHVARRMEQHEALFAARIADAFRPDDPARAGHLAVGGGTAAWVAPDSVLSKVYGLGVAGPVSDADLDAIEDFYRARGEKKVQFELAPFAGVELLARLEDRGYRIRGCDQILVRALGAADSEAPPPPAGVTVEAIDPADAEGRAAWARVSADGFFAPAASPPDIRRYSELCFDVPGTVAWLARVDGAPAASGAHALADGICALFAGATLPERRRRGSHAALIAARLAAGARAGAEFAMVGAQPGGASHKHLEAAGFRAAYTRYLFVRAWE
jgi:hypothetical protein